MRSWTIWCSPMIRPCDSRLSARSHIMSKASVALGDGAHGVVDPAAAQAALGEYLGPVLGSEQMVEGYADLVVDDVVVVAGLGLDLDARAYPGAPRTCRWCT